MTSRRIADTYGLTIACTKILSTLLRFQAKNADVLLKTSSWRWSVKYPQQPYGNIKSILFYCFPVNFDFSYYKHYNLKMIAATKESTIEHVTPTHVIKDNIMQNHERASEPLETKSISHDIHLKTPFDKDSTVKKSHVLKESKMPATRASRLFHYGGLIVGLGVGAVGEVVRRATGLSDTRGSSVMMNEANVDRLVSKLSRMRGAALKLGQMLSVQDNDMLPTQIGELMLRVQNSANYMPNWQMESVLTKELSPNWRNHFLNFDPVPMAAASIGQVHSAQLASSGMPVAIKIQYPGVVTSIDSDLNNLRMLARASNLLPKGLYLDNTIKVARRELAWETDYIREAECMEKFRDLLKDDMEFSVPQVIKEYSTKMVLTSERMMGAPLTHAVNYKQELRDCIGENILRLCLRELFEFKFMQTDPNWTNFLYNANTGKIELVDFGASRSFDDHFTECYLQILISAANQDRKGCEHYSEKIGFLTGCETEKMKNAHVDSIITLGEPFSVSIYDFSKQTITNRVRSLIPTMLKYRLTPPPDETYSLHRKLSGAFLLCAKLGAKVRCKKIFEDVVGKF